jgi:Flp pilus assembly protein TadD
MLSKLKSRYVWLTGAAIIAMALVFVAAYDWGEDESTITGVSLRSTSQRGPVRTVAPVTPTPAPAPATTVAVGESEAVAASVEEPEEEVTYEEAEAAFLDKRYDRAVELFTRYTDRKSENPWGFYMLGLSAWKAGDHGNAEGAFARALELDPRHVKSYINVSRVLLETSRPAEALEKIDEALAIDPESNAAQRLRGRAYYQLGQTEEAVAAYRRAIQIDNQDAWSMNNMALIFIEQGRYDEALPALARAVELNDTTAVFYNNLGMALECVGHFRASEDAYRLAVASDGSHGRAQDNLGRIDVVLEDPALETVDLAALAGKFVTEIESWSVAVADSEPTDTVEADVGAGESGVTEADSTDSDQDR